MTTTVRSRPMPSSRASAQLSVPAEDPGPEPGIGIRYEGSTHARLWLSGPVDTDLLSTLAAFLRVLLRTPARFIVLDLGDTLEWDTRLLKLITRTQHCLTERAGMISLVGVDTTNAATAITDIAAGQPAAGPALGLPCRAAGIWSSELVSV